MLNVRLPEKGIFKLPWRKAGPLHHLDDKVDSDQQVVNQKSLSLYQETLLKGESLPQGGLRKFREPYLGGG